MRWMVLAWVAVLGGCGDDVVTFQTPLEAVCGEDEAVVLVEMTADEKLNWIWPFGDDASSIVVSVGPNETPPSGELAEEYRRVVVDPCGEELGRASVRLDYLWSRQDHVFACSMDHDLVHLTAIDDPSPEILARGSCFAPAFGGVTVGLDAEPDATVARLVAIAPTSGGVQTSTLLDGVRRGPGTTVHVVGDRLFVQLDADGSVVVVDPTTGESWPELAEASMFEPSARAIAYRPVDAETTVRVLARESGAAITIADDVTEDAHLHWYSDVLLWAVEPEADLRWFSISPPHEIVPPDGTTILAIRDDGLSWLRREHHDPWRSEFLRWREGESPEVAMDCRGCWPEHSATDGIYVGVETAYVETYELWRIDDDGGPRKVAYPISVTYQVFEDGRVLSVDNADQQSVFGPLLLFDGKGGPGYTIAEGVEHRAPVLTTVYDSPGDILYEARDDDGTAALHRARLASP